MFSFYMPTRLIMGPGSLNELANIKLDAKKALIVTTSGKSVKKYGYLDRVEKLLNNRGITTLIFDKVLPNPIRKHVMEAAEIARENSCDIIVGLGGGSAIDTAKCAAAMAVNEGDLWDYIGAGTGKGLVPKNGSLPIIAITTTAGTGTEADPWAVTTNEETHEKIDFGNDLSFPYVSIVDPELMVTVPERLTIYQGFDALFHSVEGFIATSANSISDALALKAIELISRNLPIVAANGQDIEARSNMAIANTMSGIVESTSNCTSEHSIAHALSGYHPGLTHGECLIAISLTYHEMFINSAKDKYILMAKAMGENVDSLDEDEKPKAFLKALRKLQISCKVDNIHMNDYGVDKNKIEEYTQFAYDTMGELFEEDPRQLTIEETADIIRKSIR